MMTKSWFFVSFCLCFLSGGLSGADLAAAVARLENPTIAEAKLVLSDLERMIAEGDARTVTLGKKMHRSIRRIFTQEHRVQEAKKKADQDEARARQLRRNGDEWLKPNVHGRINEIAARAAYGEARTLRKKSEWKREELSREWIAEVADFEKMLGDLEFSREWSSLLILAETLAALVERTPWVDRPELSYGPGRLRFLRERVANHDRWLLLARHAAEARDFELSFHFYRQVGDEEGWRDVGRRWAGQLEEQGYPGTALSLWQHLGEKERLEALQANTPTPQAGDFKAFDLAALERIITPACVRVVRADGSQSGFFVRPGGVLVTSREGLEDKKGKLVPPRVILSDGRERQALILQPESDHELVLLQIELVTHPVLPLGSDKDLQTGGRLALFGYAGEEELLAASVQGTILSLGKGKEDGAVFRLAMDGSEGHRGGPLVDQRGRVLGVFLSSKTGETKALSAAGVRSILGKP
jgi:hypothetical protein